MERSLSIPDLEFEAGPCGSVDSVVLNPAVVVLAIIIVLAAAGPAC